MINEVISKLNECAITDVVVTEKEMLKKSNVDCKYIADARSAAFYAFGLALREGKSVALLVDGELLPNVLSAATEAWFQKANLIIIALYRHFSNVHCEYFERCVLKHDTVEKIDKKLLQECRQKKGPVLINLIDTTLEYDNYDYGQLPKWLDGEKVYLYHPNKTYEETHVKTIEAKHRYGVISRYMGMTAVTEEKRFLCCPAECFMVDLNVFNNRYSVKNTRMIILDYDNLLESNKIDKWLKSNGVQCVFVDAVNQEHVEKVKGAEYAIALIVRKAVA